MMRLSQSKQLYTDQNDRAYCFSGENTLPTNLPTYLPTNLPTYQPTAASLR